MVIVGVVLFSRPIPFKPIPIITPTTASTVSKDISSTTAPTKPPATKLPPVAATATEANVSPTTASLGDTWTSPLDGMTMVYVPAGEFLMGSESGHADEKPQHRVILDGYWIDRTEVTNSMYARCVQAGVCNPPSDRSTKIYHSNFYYERSLYYGNTDFDQFPVVNVNWKGASAYCAWIGERLPSEAEWEKTARGTDGRTYPWGEKSPDCPLLNFNEMCEPNMSAVGRYPAGGSPYGALDMAGNVWEWVNDWYSANYYASSPTSNPPGSSIGNSRVLRGGSRFSGARDVRASNRSYGPMPGDFSGFRCVR